ncbi:hypothetical protein OPV22_008496 [Ensete ventricosum]|uniref:Alkyl hydroperoxide reductase subunit C/ Thiol specific antioxidant domain-containing protein n=1 Tax=Ensete ventricosum TaxID=4639 RepID=A0AAV8R8H2_ENSVE|nr:hypothetical protein OPV22_008496 [Ensete ventricosum]
MAILSPRSLALSLPRLSPRSSPPLGKPSVSLADLSAPSLPRRLPLTVRRAASANPSPLTSADASTWEALRDVSVLAASTGEPVLFKDLWDQNEGVAVVALLRHFGCICCWELASVLKDSMPRFDSAGVKLIAVGVGTPDRARILAERLPFPLDCLYADPDRKAYDILGLYYGLGRTFFNPASAKVFSRWDSIKKAGKNYTIAATPDDKASVLQQGGMLMKSLTYAAKSQLHELGQLSCIIILNRYSSNLVTKVMRRCYHCQDLTLFCHEQVITIYIIQVAEVCVAEVVILDLSCSRCSIR